MNVFPGAATLAAIEELRAIRSTDPCAAIAITTVKATIHTLETHWVGGSSRRPTARDAG